jgi:hypothetical protein
MKVVSCLNIVDEGLVGLCVGDSYLVAMLSTVPYNMEA